MWEWLVDKVSSFINWLGRLITKIWGVIQGWWSKLKGYIREKLREFLEVIIIDPRQKAGREFYEAIKKTNPRVNSLDDIDKLSVGINQDGSVGMTEDLKAKAMSQDAFDVASAENNGILRIQ